MACPDRAPLVYTSPTEARQHRLIMSLFLFALAAPALAEMPVVPCAGMQVEFPPVNAEPSIRIYKENDVAAWKPAACTGWPAEKFEFIGTAAASFRHIGGSMELTRRYAAISEYAAMRYFSPRRQAWRELSFEAFALQDANPANKRGDFAAAEFVPGSVRYFWQRGATEARPPSRALWIWLTVSRCWNARRIA
jgi:hypothetical protein